ncbi:MAG: glycoside hydrolase family 172 protein [Verrucomicrobiota bacterium]
MRSPLFPLLLAAACAASASAQDFSLFGLDQARNFESRRVSSSDADWRNGNNDARPIKPGGTLTLAELDGPGRIVHFWCTVAQNDPFYSCKLTLRMYWDGEEHPSVECPLGDFFGIGFGLDRPFTSLPIRVSSEGRGRNCYWPMPFRKKARITVTNESDRMCDCFYYYVDWQKYASLPDDTLYFHAAYRQEFPCVMGRNYLIADIEGRGQYVGTVQSVMLVSPGWFGEGDDFFFIDGEKEPSLRGTGTEDYFCDGWGFREQAGPFYGTPLWEGFGTGNRGSAYRFHVPDPITFRKSLRVEIEHKGSQEFPDGKGSGFIERDDLMSSVAFWYQTEPHKPWPALPAGADRVPFREKIVVKGHEKVASAQHADYPIETQNFQGATDGKQMVLRPKDGHGWLEIAFEVPEDQSGELIAKMCHSYDYGNYRVLLDGTQVARLNLYDSIARTAEDKLGRQTLKAGKHTLRFECTGKSPQSDGYFIGFDALAFRVPVYSRAPSVDLRTLQK